MAASLYVSIQVSKYLHSTYLLRTILMPLPFHSFTRSPAAVVSAPSLVLSSFALCSSSPSCLVRRSSPVARSKNGVAGHHRYLLKTWLNNRGDETRRTHREREKAKEKEKERWRQIETETETERETRTYTNAGSQGWVGWLAVKLRYLGRRE
ncbi:hypothetical protein LZ31DRAFT_352316 [Colletotrichum somersetense]|nr:hypothetical protein LZ31DRAFT_352316 [Colletotrichum somersetense]